MNLKSESTSKKAIFKERKISFAEVPNQTKLFIDYQNNERSLDKFYPTKNSSFEDLKIEVLENYKVDRNKLCDLLVKENNQYEVSDKTLLNIEKLRDESCVTVLTGQQAGLFSGSIYSIYKALSAIKLADDLTKQGIKAVPIFWIASEDHDFEEISETILIDKNEKCFEVQYSPEEMTADIPIGLINIEINIKDSLNMLFDGLAKTEFTGQINELLSKTYKTNESFSTAFGKLLAKIFHKFGLIFVNPLNEGLRTLCTPVYQSAIENYDAIAEKLLVRNDELTENNYHSQVLVEDGFFPFFYIDKDKKRNSLRFDKDKNNIRSQDYKFEFTKAELLEIAENKPHQLSPNALMRPIVQDYLFPTVCYFGGGAEISYFGQNSVIYNTLKRPITPIRHRASFSIIQGKHRRTLQKYNLEFKDLFKGKEKILGEIVEEYRNTPTAKAFSDTEVIINKQLKELDEYLIVDEPTLSDNLENRKKKILWHIATLRKKFHQAEIIKDEVFYRRFESLWASVLTKGVLQERNLNVLYFLNLYGENFIDWIYYAVETDEKNHQIVIF